MSKPRAQRADRPGKATASVRALRIVALKARQLEFVFTLRKRRPKAKQDYAAGYVIALLAEPETLAVLKPPRRYVPRVWAHPEEARLVLHDLLEPFDADSKWHLLLTVTENDREMQNDDPLADSRAVAA